MNYGKGIREIRTRKKITQDQLAEKIGMTQNAISSIERGLASPHPSTLKKIAKALKVPEVAFVVLGLDEKDVPKENRLLYQQLKPILDSLVGKIIS
jgi:transcriptional regulator with XRE-family HTH domain